MFPLTRKKCVSQGSRMLFFIPTVHSPELSSLTGLVIDQPKATVGAMQGRAEPTRDQGLVVPEGRQVRSYLASTSAASLSPPGQGVRGRDSEPEFSHSTRSLGHVTGLSVLRCQIPDLAT